MQVVQLRTSKRKEHAANAPTRSLDRPSVVAAIADYIRQVNYRGYEPDHRKVLAVRESDRTASLRNAVTPVRWEVYYYIEGELFTEVDATRLTDADTPRSQAERLVDGVWDSLWVWNAYDFTPTSSGLNQGYSSTAPSAAASRAAGATP